MKRGDRGVREPADLRSCRTDAVAVERLAHVDEAKPAVAANLGGDRPGEQIAAVVEPALLAIAVVAVGFRLLLSALA